MNLVMYDDKIKEIKIEDNVKEWPVIYLLSNNNQIYIGETNNIVNRLDAHKNKINKNDLKFVKIFMSNEFNKSAIYDIETKLIDYIYAENNFEVLNKALNQQNLSYYNKSLYNDKYFNLIWDKLKEIKVVKNDINVIENKLLFKYSPFKSLSSEQYNIVIQVLNRLFKGGFNENQLNASNSDTKYFYNTFNEEQTCSVINGSPGTGKTLLIIKLLKLISETVDLKNYNVAFCVPQSSIRKELESMVKVMKISNVEVITPLNINKKYYDVLIIDEAHRLKRYNSKFSQYPRHLLIDEENKVFINELELSKKHSKHLILMYDEFQKIRDSDIEDFNSYLPKYNVTLNLNAQFRVKAGTNYISFIRNLLQIQMYNDDFDLGDYDVQFTSSIRELHEKIVEKENEFSRCRLGSGYYVKFDKESKKLVKKGLKFDFEDEGYNINWNTKTDNWFNSKNAVNEIGCIHTLQGYDLNYMGVIFGDEIIYNTETKRIEIIPEKYMDKMCFPLKSDPEFYEKLCDTVKNVYYVLLTRGILGTFIYVKDKNLEVYLKEQFKLKGVENGI